MHRMGGIAELTECPQCNLAASPSLEGILMMKDYTMEWKAYTIKLYWVARK